MNPYAILGGVLLAGAALGGAYWQGRQDGASGVIAAQADAEQIRQDTIRAADEGTARALARLEIKHVTIKQQADTVVREVPVYRDCRHDGRMLDAINAALRQDQSADPGVMPAASAPDR